MNEYDDSDDYSSANSFRARSNTWPLKRPDLVLPSDVCIDETLPEIELEEDDLFTTNENWATGLVDHDIMSWDPILNAQSHHHPNHQQQHTTTTTNQQLNQHQTATIHHHHQQQQQQHQRQAVHQQPQLQQQQPHQPPQQHDVLLSDPNDYHIQLHHLRLDSNQPYPSMCIQGSAANLGNESYNISSDHQHHHLQPLTSARYPVVGLLDQQLDPDYKQVDPSAILQNSQFEDQTQDHQHHHLQPLTSAIYDLDQQLDPDYKQVDPSAILQNAQFEDKTLDQLHQQSDGSVGNGNKLSISSASSKTKLNTPRRNAWGNMSYADLISQAINSTDDKRLTLSQIYDWMVQHVPYFKDKGDSNSSAGWKNSVRHNLSLHNRFKRLQNEGTGKSSWWTINPEANIGKCARRRAASMEASKYEKKRGRAKKRADAVRKGLVSYLSLTNSSLNDSTGNLEQSSSQYGPQQQQQIQPQPQPQPQPPPPPPPPPQQQLEELNPESLHSRQHNTGCRLCNTGLYVASPQETQYESKSVVLF